MRVSLSPGGPASAIDQAELMALLREAPLFQVLGEPELTALRDQVDVVFLAGGETLFRQGEPGDSLYVVVSGRLGVLLELSGETGARTLAELGRGESVGEMALLAEEPRSASVIAIRDTTLVRLSRQAFERVVAGNPRAMMQLARTLVARLRRTGRGEPQRRVSTIAAVAAGQDVPLHNFITRLAAALAPAGSTLYLTASRVDAYFGAQAAESGDQTTQARVNAWLDAQERHYRFVIYEAGTPESAWTARCLRQADRVLLVARPGSNADPCVRALAGSRAQPEAVLLHESCARRPSGTARWLDTLHLSACHHVCVAERRDYERLARMLTGRNVGLVLSGGGARGFAHIGVIRALREAGIPIDRVGGTSMGAAIAAQVALGLDYSAMVDLNRLWTTLDPLNDKTVPLVSLMTGRKLERLLSTMFGEIEIEDLWIQYFSVAANLTLAEPVIQQRGQLRRTLRASMSIPGMAPPVCEGGNLIVDGGVLNNLPGDVMRQLGAAIVIAVNVSPEKDLPVDPSLREAPSARRILWSRVKPFGKPTEFPSLLAIMMRTVMLSSIHGMHEMRRKADLFIEPALEEFHIFDWQLLERIVEAGYRFAQKRIEEWERAPDDHTEAEPPGAGILQPGH
jgi:predicted acylesterase/phospholipase RssA/CRP-like cAMP-binding protein